MSEPDAPAPLILTLGLDHDNQRLCNQLRREHFPSERNYLDAHVTLFHQLPGEEEAKVRSTLDRCRQRAPLPLRLASLRFLGRGVAIDIECPPLLALRGELAAQWAPWLNAQDRQRYRPHVTIQNKVAPASARQLLDELSPWEPRAGQGTGLLLWRYLGGPWERLSAHPFGAGSASSSSSSASSASE